jgi:putative spermidine/putrescine transport system substrate-binding protein
MRIGRILAGVLLVLTVGGVFAYVLLSRKPPVLTAVTWAGPYGHAQASALFVPYALKAGINVHIAEYDGGLKELRGGHTGWDVVDLELPDAIRACREGLLERLDGTTLPAAPDGRPAEADFVANALGPCWVGSVVYSQVIAYSPRRFGEARPQTAGDFFDLARFPGPRALRSSDAKFNLEMALLADGVRPSDVYRLLATDEGLRRAFAKLDMLKGSIVWWTRSSEPAEMLADGRAAFATILNGDVYDAAVRNRVLGVIWDRQLYELDVFGVPKESRKGDMALDFIRFATSTQRLARVAQWVPYGPARLSAGALTGNNPELGIPMRPYLPTAPGHFSTAFAIDDAWWQVHGAEIAGRWRAWRARQVSPP